MPTKWNMLRQRLAKLVIYKYVIIVILAIVILDTSYLLGYIGNDDRGDDHFSVDNVNSGDNDSITGDISSLVSRTSVNDTIINTSSFKQRCSNCHNISMTSSGVNTGNPGCHSCHGGEHPSEGESEPSRYNDAGPRRTIHNEHTKSGNQQCVQCHSPPACTKCHNGHVGIDNFNVSKDCKTCHMGLPNPIGHSEERTTFKSSMHSWATCDTCHKKAEFGFKDLATYSFDNSSQLCANCHSKQYKDSGHYIINDGKEEKRCIDCHNPHSYGEPTFSLKGIEGISTVTDNITGYLNNNMGFVGLFALLVLSAIFEYVFRPKKGQVILTKHLKIEHDKSKARTIKISLGSFDHHIVNQITDILDINNAEIVGISAGNNEAIVFISRDKKDNDKNIIKNIRSISGVLKAEYSKDYEVR